MAQALRLDLKQSQQLVMTPQLQQAIKLLQMSNLELHGFLEHELEKNPLLRIEETGELGIVSETEGGVEKPAEIGAESPLDARLTPEGDPSLAAETFDTENFESGSPQTGAGNLYDAGPGDATGPGAGAGSGGSQSFDAAIFDLDQQPDHPATLREHLLAQLGQCRAPVQVLALAQLISAELDEHGYLRDDPDALAMQYGAAPGIAGHLAAQALALVQGCEPTGVGARNLAECLTLQLTERDRLDPMMRRLIDNLALLERGERRRLQALCGVGDEDFAQMLVELRALDPRPCAAFRTERAETLIPDVLLRRAPGIGDAFGDTGGWEIELNPETLPRVLVDNRYAARLSGTGPEAKSFVAECRASANWLVRSLDQRARTILKVATEIIRHQDRFFREGIAGLQPLTLRMVADETGMHESTVSRVTSNKYIATERGIFELKFFFTNAIGADGSSAEAVRHRIRLMVDAEIAGAVLSDDDIVGRLQKDGVEIARRTVAKYRKQLGIASSIERRRRKVIEGAA